MNKNALKILSDILIIASILVIGYFHFSQHHAHPFDWLHALLLLILPFMFIVVHWGSLRTPNESKEKKK